MRDKTIHEVITALVKSNAASSQFFPVFLLCKKKCKSDFQVDNSSLLQVYTAHRCILSQQILNILGRLGRCLR